MKQVFLRVLFPCLIGIQLLLYAHGSFAQEGIDCNEPSGPIRADDSPSVEQFKALSKKGADAPIQDFMVLWYPNRQGTTISDEEFKACADQNNCQGDTAYNWGVPGRINNMKTVLQDGGDWSGVPNPNHLLDTLFSAVGSFAYGSVPVRIRLRSPHHVTPEAEYLIKDASAIESWSYGTPEHYDEIVRDYLRYASGKLWYG